MQRMQLLFPDEMIARLKEVSREEERPVSEVIRRSIEEFFMRYPKGKKRKITVDHLAGPLGRSKSVLRIFGRPSTRTTGFEKP